MILSDLNFLNYLQEKFDGDEKESSPKRKYNHEEKGKRSEKYKIIIINDRSQKCCFNRLFVSLIIGNMLFKYHSIMARLECF